MKANTKAKYLEKCRRRAACRASEPDPAPVAPARPEPWFSSGAWNDDARQRGNALTSGAALSLTGLLMPAVMAAMARGAAKRKARA